MLASALLSMLGGIISARPSKIGFSEGPADRSTKCDVFNVFSLLFGYDLIVTLLF